MSKIDGIEVDIDALSKIEDESLKELFKIVQVLFNDLKLNNNLDTELEPKKRRSGNFAYLHSYRVALYLKEIGIPKEYIIAGLFHDVAEDTLFKEKWIREILNSYLRKYPNAFEDKGEEYIDKIIDAINRLTKKEGFAKCYDILKLKTSDGEQVAIENFWGKIKIYKIDKDGKNDNNLMEEKALIPKLSEENKKKFEEYKTKTNDYKRDMDDYIDGICESQIAMVVKIADRIDNLREIAETDSAEWIEKYTLETIWISSMLDRLEKDKKLDNEKINLLKKDLHNALRDAEDTRKERNTVEK